MPKSKKSKLTNPRHCPYKKERAVIHRIDVDSRKDIEIGHNRIRGSVSSSVFKKGNRIEISDAKKKENVDGDLELDLQFSHIRAKDSNICIYDDTMLFKGSLYIYADGNSLVTVAVPDDYCVMVHLKDNAVVQIIGSNCRIQSIDRSLTSRLDIIVPPSAKNINISSNELSGVYNYSSSDSSSYDSYSDSSSECFSSSCSEAKNNKSIASSSKNVLKEKASPSLLSSSSTPSPDDTDDFSDTIRDPIRDSQELMTSNNNNNNNNHMLFNLSPSSSNSSNSSFTSYQPVL